MQENGTLQELRAYLDGYFADVQGWCNPRLWQCIQPIDAIQRENGIDGPIAEIGVFQGKFFIGLLKTKQAKPNFAIDIFSMQRFNLDGAGAGDLEILRANLEASGENVADVRFLERDSMSIDRRDVEAIREESGGFSMFSVDGCHTVQHTINDTRIAMELTVAGGVIFVDDYYNVLWPGVQEGISKLFFHDEPRFVPLVVSCNKLILCHISYHREYLAHVTSFLKENFRTTRLKRVKRFGYDSLTALPDMQRGPFLADTGARATGG